MRSPAPLDPKLPLAEASSAAPGDGVDLSSCFDPATAELPVRRVPARRIVDPLAVSHAADRIAAYRAAMLAGARFPPIAVLPLAGRYWIADGHKRWSAYRTFGAPDVVVEVWTARRWLRDQLRQCGATGRRLGRALSLLAVRPSEGVALLRAAPQHWWRVARSLAAHARSSAAGSWRRRVAP